jgi:leucyl-tRNA synthetase
MLSLSIGIPMNPPYDPKAVEEKWQKRWADAKIFESEKVEGREKFYIMFAYPGVSGYLHLGHMRGYTYTDVIARYKRMKGFNVLFPVGTHASGNVAYAFAKKIDREDEKHLEYLRLNGCPEDEIPKLKNHEEVIKFFNQVYLNDYWKRFGFSADFRRFTSTVFEDYQKFIQWQFRKLKMHDLLIQKEYYSEFCPADGPVAVDPSETDLQKGGKAEKLEYTILKFKWNGAFLLAATLRPETVFGQTNFWVHPDLTYARIKVGNEEWIVSKECAEKLRWQKDDVESIGEHSGRELIGSKCISPYIDRELPILPATFCDPDVGTGMVTSVPSDAPIDWMALKDLIEDEERAKSFGLVPEELREIEPLPIIESKGYGPFPAVEICDSLGIKDQNDPKLDEATKLIYKAGFHGGKMNENCGKYFGLPVPQVKDSIRDEMVEMGLADLFYDLSEEVVCRCGERVIIKKIPDQWFINYGDDSLTERAKIQASKMNVYPKEYHDNLPKVLDWFKERACVRMGNWLGTRFPFDDRWIIEPISDSTLYPAYYVVSKYVNSGEINAEQLGDEFFDYVYLGIGSAEDVSGKTGIGVELVNKIAEDFKYWYPVDINLGGKEHMTVHFPVFLMNHVGLLTKDNWPQGIFVNWWITWKGGMRISKSKGGAVPIPNAAEQFTVDGMRLYYSHVASPFVDVEWDVDKVHLSRDRLERIRKSIDHILEIEGEPSSMDPWLLSRINSKLGKINAAMDSLELREAANDIYYGLETDMKWYLKRGGNHRDVLYEVLNVWIRLMSPFTPHLAEELWETIGMEQFVSLAEYPKPEESKIDTVAEASEKYLISVSDDVSEILKVTKMKPDRIRIYTVSDVQRKVFEIGLELKKDGRLNIGGIIEKAEGVAERSFIGEYASGMIKELAKWSPLEIDEYSPIDEKGYLEGAKEFLEAEFGCSVDIHSADEDVPDPKNRKKKAIPLKPAIFIE